MLSGQIPGQPHTAMASSRTRCSLITLGASPSPKWQTTASLAISFQIVPILPLREDAVAERASLVPAFVGFRHPEDDLSESHRLSSCSSPLTLSRRSSLVTATLPVGQLPPDRPRRRHPPRPDCTSCRSSPESRPPRHRLERLARIPNYGDAETAHSRRPTPRRRPTPSPRTRPQPQSHIPGKDQSPHYPQPITNTSPTTSRPRAPPARDAPAIPVHPTAPPPATLSVQSSAIHLVTSCAPVRFSCTCVSVVWSGSRTRNIHANRRSVLSNSSAKSTSSPSYTVI